MIQSPYNKAHTLHSEENPSNPHLEKNFKLKQACLFGYLDLFRSSSVK